MAPAITRPRRPAPPRHTAPAPSPSPSARPPRPSTLAPLLILLIPLLALAASSCSNSAPMARVLAGNLAHGRGQYQKAILHYLNAQKHPGSAEDALHYNLGSVYYALGEGEAALRAWAQAENSTGDLETLFRVAFNRGVLYYQWGRFEEAYRSFRRALVLKPSDIDTKINLEDSLSRIRTELSAPGSAAPSAADSDEGARRLLDYVRRKETGDWSKTDTPADTSTPDW